MKAEIIDILSIVMMVVAMVLLVVMNVGAFNPMTLNILRALLAISLIITGLLFNKSQKA